VVATGLRGVATKTGPRGVVSDKPPLRRSASGDFDYGSLDKPTINRRTSAVSEGSTARKIDVDGDSELDYLDVPAFLRKQAD
jgi:cell division protein FtsZ